MSKNIGISYDLYSPDQNYKELKQYFKSHNGYCEVNDSFYFIDSDKDVKTIRDEIKNILDKNGSFIVFEMVGNWASWGFPCSDWLK